MRIFEDALFPRALRWEYAIGNVVSDAGCVGENFKEEFVRKANLLYPDWQTADSRARIGMLSLMLPVGCNASCPGICFTDIQNWKRRPDHLSFEEIIGILEEFRIMGGRVVRIIGDGEPTLYRQFPELAQWCRQSGIGLVVFTNGVVMPRTVVEEYAQGGVYFYVKLWSEDKDVQTRMVAPRVPYRYYDGPLGKAPQTFYDLYEIDPGRVGFQVMASSINLEDAMRIINGPKKELPILAEPFIPEGAGKDHKELMVKSFHGTKACERPPRRSYLAVVNSVGRLQAGTFVPEGAVSVKENKFTEVWSRIHATNNLFFKARYSAGCFCEAMRIASRKK